jgi:hypothetical protein
MATVTATMKTAPNSGTDRDPILRNQGAVVSMRGSVVDIPFDGHP